MKTDKILADFQLLNNKVLEFYFQNKLLNTNDKISIDCEMDYEIISCIEDEDRYFGAIDFIVGLSGKVGDSEAFKIHLIMRGNFAGSKKNLTINSFREMLEVNGTATLSQLSRAFLTSATSLSGIKTIILPMVNIYAMKRYKEKNPDKKPQ